MCPSLWCRAEYFRYPESPLCCAYSSPTPTPLATTAGFPVSVLWPFPQSHGVGAVQPVPIGFFHLVVYIWDSSTPFCSWMAHFVLVLSRCLGVPQLLHFPPEGLLGCLRVLAIVSKAAVNSYVQFVRQHEFSSPLGKYEGAPLPDGVETVCFLW